MLNNVIAFPQPRHAPVAEKATRGSQTLFIHIKRTTMIVHLAAANQPAVNATRVGKTT